MTRTNYYTSLAADFSAPGLVTSEQSVELVETMNKIHTITEPQLPPVDSAYSFPVIEDENREWFPTHCNALRQQRFDLLEAEYREEFVYLCADGPFAGRGSAAEREQNWVAIIAQPGATMTWPIVQFSGEVVYFEWLSLDDATHEPIAKGNVTFLRRGHRGGIYLKTEQLTFFRDVSASSKLLATVVA